MRLKKISLSSRGNGGQREAQGDWNTDFVGQKSQWQEHRLSCHWKLHYWL
jgi:hypothetical protein